jgi:hypothetical protein
MSDKLTVRRDGRYPVELDKERHLLFDLYAMAEIQSRFGGIDKINEIVASSTGMKDLIWLLTLLLNEGADDGEEELTERQVGRLVHTGNMNEVRNAIYKAFAQGKHGKARQSKDEDIDDDEDETKNKRASAS